MQDFDVLGSEGVFLLSALLKIPRQGINSPVSLALTMVDLKVVNREFLSLADLSGAQTFRVHKSSKVVIIGKYKNFMSRVLWIVPLGIKSFNNG